MALVIPPGFAQAAWIFQSAFDPDPYEVTCGVDVSSAGGNYSGAANDLFNNWAGNLLTEQWVNLTLVRVDLLVGQDPPPNLVVSSTETSDDGGTTAAFLPQNCALLVKKLSASGGRANRGRFFVPYILAESEVDSSGLVDTGVRSGLQTKFDTFLSEVQGGTLVTDLVILHDDTASTLPDPTVITSLVVQGIIATQRRRLR